MPIDIPALPEIEDEALRRVLIFGNSGSGKSTLAKQLQSSDGLSHLDLDILAWQGVSPPQRRSLQDSERDILGFINTNESWVIEGCYSDLLQIAIPGSNELIFLDLPVESCIMNARNRPWEPHKYETEKAQDDNLGMLIDWIAQYPERTDTFSQAAHRKLFDDYPGKKRMCTSNDHSV